MKKVSQENKLLDVIIKAAEDKKALNPVILDVRRTGRLADFMVIISGDSTPQLKAITREIEANLKKLNVKGVVWEGETDSGWLIFDIGSILVHVMSEKERAYYDLEGLWGKDAIIYH